MFQIFCFYDKFTAFSTSRGILPGTFLFFTEVILMPDQKEYYMRRALALAARGAGHVDPNPMVGCVIVKDGAVVGRGRNRREAARDALAHAELEAIRQANEALGTWRLDNCTLYVTLEPCPMCAGAILNARIPRVYYGARDREMGACGGVLNLFMEDFPARPALVGGVLREECHQVLADFFRSLRGPNGQKREI